MTSAYNTMTQTDATNALAACFEIDSLRKEFYDRIIIKVKKNNTYRFIIEYSENKFETSSKFIGSPTHAIDNLIFYNTKAEAVTNYIEYTATYDDNVCYLDSSNAPSKKRFVANAFRLHAVNSGGYNTLYVSEFYPVMYSVADVFYGRQINLSEGMTIATAKSKENVINISKDGFRMWGYAGNLHANIGLQDDGSYGAWFPQIRIGGGSWSVAPFKTDASGNVSIEATQSSYTGARRDGIIQVTQNSTDYSGQFKPSCFYGTGTDITVLAGQINVGANIGAGIHFRYMGSASGDYTGLKLEAVESQNQANRAFAFYNVRGIDFSSSGSGGDLQEYYINNRLKINYSTDAVLRINNRNTGYYSFVELQDAGIARWQILKHPDNSFSIYQCANSYHPFSIDNTLTTNIGGLGFKIPSSPNKDVVFGDGTGWRLRFLRSNDNAVAVDIKDDLTTTFGSWIKAPREYLISAPLGEPAELYLGKDGLSKWAIYIPNSVTDNLKIWSAVGGNIATFKDNLGVDFAGTVDIYSGSTVQVRLGNDGHIGCNGYIDALGSITCGGIDVNRYDNGNSAHRLWLYPNHTYPFYIQACSTANGGGTHGYVTGGWATYFAMSDDSDGAYRGWIFRSSYSRGNVASISCDGRMTLNKGLVINGESGHTGVNRLWLYTATDETPWWLGYSPTSVFGGHGDVSGNCAMYLTVDNTSGNMTTRGWIFRAGHSACPYNVASISVGGTMTINGAFNMAGGNFNLTNDKIIYQTNNQWGGKLQIGYSWYPSTPEEITSTQAFIASSNGNLHLDSMNGHKMYLNYHSQQGIYVGRSIWIEGNANTLDIHSQYGTVQIGACNSSFIHFWSDNKPYYFSNKIIVEGELCVGNTADINCYLRLNRYNASDKYAYVASNLTNDCGLKFQIMNSSGVSITPFILQSSGEIWVNYQKLIVYKNAPSTNAYYNSAIEIRTDDATCAILGFHRVYNSAMSLYHAGYEMPNLLRISSNAGGDYAVLHEGYANAPIIGSSGNNSGGVSFYCSPSMDYGVSLRTTASLGTHGSTTTAWAAYFFCNNDAGWIFRNNTNGNMASISNTGALSLNGNVTVTKATSDALITLDTGVSYNSGIDLKYDGTLKWRLLRDWGSNDFLLYNAQSSVETIRIYSTGNRADFYGSITTKGSFGCFQTGGSGNGISLYGNDTYTTTYGIMFATTGNFGTHGYVTADWATYFNMNNDSGRGWVFRANGVGNVASISAGGSMCVNNYLTVGSSTVSSISPFWVAKKVGGTVGLFGQTDQCPIMYYQYSADYTGMAFNAYHNGTSWYNITGSKSTFLIQHEPLNGALAFYGAPAVTAGGVPQWVKAFSIGTDGTAYFGGTSSLGENEIVITKQSATAGIAVKVNGSPSGISVNASGGYSANTIGITTYSQYTYGIKADSGSDISIYSNKSLQFNINNLSTSGGAYYAFFDATGKLIRGGSSIRYKTEVNELPSAINTLKVLKPVSFKWKNGGMFDFGIIAEWSPEFLQVKSKEGIIESVSYHMINMITLKATQEQQSIIEQQEARIAELETKLAEILELLTVK